MPANTLYTAVLTLASAGALTLTACGDGDVPVTPTAGADKVATQPAPRARPAGQAGVVTAVVPIYSSEPTTGAGAVVGGVLGAAVGNQVGGGNGKKAATVIGAVGGAVAGNEVEKRRNQAVTGYRVDVRLADGSTTSVTLKDADHLAAGQSVRVVDGRVVPA